VRELDSLQKSWGHSTHSQFKPFTQQYFVSTNSNILNCLPVMLRNEDYNKVMIFCQTGHIALYVRDILNANFLPSLLLNPDDSNKNTVFPVFWEQKKAVLVTSSWDTSGFRGRDVDLVVSFGAPTDFDEYIRCMREAAIGPAPKSVLMLRPYEKDQISKLEGDNITVEEIHPPPEGKSLGAPVASSSIYAFLSYRTFLLGDRFSTLPPADVKAELGEFRLALHMPPKATKAERWINAAFRKKHSKKIAIAKSREDAEELSGSESESESE